MHFRFAVWAGFLVAALTLAGCGGDGTAEVTGNVTVDGTPIEAGAIRFVPVDGKSPTAGAEIKQGRYAARVPVGPAKVGISMSKVVGKKKLYATPNSPEMPITAEALPPKYNEKTELTFDVQPGRNEKDFALTTK